MSSGNVVIMLWSAVIADVLAFIVAVILLRGEFRKMKTSDEKGGSEAEESKHSV